MCIIAIARHASPRFPLIVAANRDERHDRPTAPADWWVDRPDILSGRDLEAGGTWLGISTAGRFAAVTNVFEGRRAPAERSRGTLLADFLVGAVAADRYARAIDGDRFGPFNLLLLDAGGLHYVSNRHQGGILGAGVHAFSNNRQGEDWPKVARLEAALRSAIDDDGAVDNTAGGESRHDHVAGRLLEVLSGPGSRGALETAPDSMFVVGRQFGTRCSTAVVLDTSGHCVFVERRFASDGSATGESRFAFDVPKLAGAQPVATS